MTPKERVLRALSHEEPDRVPINYLANTEIDQRLKAHYGLAADDAEGLRQALGVDFRSVNPAYAGPKLHQAPEGMTADEWGNRRRWVEHTAGGYWDYCDWPLRDATLEQIEAWPLPSPDDYDYQRVGDRCRRYGDYCVVLGSAGIGDLINSSGMVRTMEQVLVDLITDNPAGLRLMQRRVAIQMEVMRRSLEIAAGGVDLLWIGEDLGTQIGPMISPELYRRHIRPVEQGFVDLAASFDVPVMIHSCGSSSWAFEDFIEIGIAAVDTLQPEAADMDPAMLKARYGDRLAMHGMISTAGPVARGSVEDVVADCRGILEVMMPGGGYAFAPTHSLQSNSPTENVVAMYEAAREFGRYA